MKETDQSRQHHFEMLVHNVHKGSPYIVKLVNNPRFFLAIPIVDWEFDSGDDQYVTMKILQPETCRGIYKIHLKDIEVLQSNSPV
jgi:hypothetical protein